MTDLSIPAQSAIPLPGDTLAVSYATSKADGHEQLIIFIPASQGGKGHTIALRADAKGFAQLMSILRARSTTPQSKAHLNSPAAPTQYILDQWGQGLLDKAAREAKSLREVMDSAKAAKDYKRKASRGLLPDLDLSDLDI